MSSGVILLTWTHPVLGEITEPVCSRHDAEVCAALRVLGIGSVGTDEHDEVVCLRCQAHPAKLPRELLRQWYGGKDSS